MGREIKFRYRIRSKETEEEFSEYFTIKRIEKGNIINEEVYEVVSRDEYTGLKDKNGKEIYERDIVKIPYYKIGRNVMIKELSHYGLFCIDLQKHSGGEFWDMCWNKKCELIGNLWEDKE